MLGNRLIRVGMMAALAVLVGCTTLHSHWPFTHREVTPPQAVAELDVGMPSDGPPPVVLQYWERNTLVLDLTNVADQGRITLHPGTGRGWPARIALRMLPRRFGELEVRGAQRLLLPVAARGTGTVTAELPPGLYGADTAQLLVSWGASGAF